ncbi:MAG: polyprenyl synthetase family protein [Candidatus Borkfalkiaceae bacterium]|nr:polyprenyl synthetase family protein [Christensenellaceae bacterium]
MYNYNGDFKAKYDEYLFAVQNVLNNVFAELNCEEKLLSAMKYSVFAGGKRVRPVLFFAALDSLDLDYNDFGAFAAAIELIHTYSLIHDDLPAMDNDDYRRGKLTNHKVFGEDFAILAGDALLNFAYEIALNAVTDKNTFAAAKTLAEFSGARGMVGGQAYDLSRDKTNDEKTLFNIDDLKTGKLLSLPFVMASLIAGGKNYDEFLNLGKILGRLFQYTDDVLDVKANFEELGKTPNKDATQNKITAVSVFGLNGAENVIEELFTSGIKTLKNIDNNSFFIDFFIFVKDRKN